MCPNILFFPSRNLYVCLYLIIFFIYSAALTAVEIWNEVKYT